MELSVEYFYDPDTKHWGFYVPSLRIVGGGQDTREEAEDAAKEAILFTLETEEVARPAEAQEGSEIGYFHVTVEKAS